MRDALLPLATGVRLGAKTSEKGYITHSDRKNGSTQWVSNCLCSTPQCETRKRFPHCCRQLEVEEKRKDVGECVLSPLD